MLLVGGLVVVVDGGEAVEGVLVGFWLVVPKSRSFTFLLPLLNRSFEGLVVGIEDCVLRFSVVMVPLVSKGFVFESNTFI